MEAVPPLTRREDGSLMGPDGAFALRGLSSQASLRQHAGGVVVGLASPDKQPAALVDFPLGKLPPRCRFLALAKAKQYWMIPSWGSRASELPVEIQLLLLELSREEGKEEGKGGGGYVLLLPLIEDNKFRASLRPSRGENGVPLDMVVVRVESGDEGVTANSFDSVLYMQLGADPYQLLEEGVEAAVKLSGSGRVRHEKRIPPTLDKFAWCTWDALWTDVCPKGIQEGLHCLREGGVPPQVLIIDDGWQQTDVDPKYRADAQEMHKLRSPEELEVDYQLSRLLTADDGQVIQPVLGKKEERERRRGGREEPAVPMVGGSLPGCVEHKGEEDGTHLAARAGGRVRGTSSSLVRWLGSVLRGVAQRCEAAAIKVVHSVVESSPSGSLVLRAFATILAGPLREPALRFYAQASCHSRRLLSVVANGKFESLDSGPESPLESRSTRFGEVVRGLKEKYELQLVYVWHAMAGYWSGIMPGVPDTARYGSIIRYPRPSPGALEVDPSFTWVQPVLAGLGLPEDPRPFHEDLHSYLQACGIDGVKVDVEATLCMFGHSGWGGYAAMGARWHSSLEESVNRHFGGRAVNSMCCSIEDLYNMSHTNLARVSEDFYPLLPASHWAHVANSAFVTLMVGTISWVDWDMFHSAHDAAHLHATARAISGGPIYVSDKVGDHDFSILRRLVLPDGSTLRCLMPGRPTADCLMHDVSRDRRSVLKVWNVNPCGGVVGLFNIQGATWSVRLRNYHQHDRSPLALSARVRPADVPDLPAAERYAAYSDALQELRVLGKRDSWEMVIAGGGGHDLITLAPIMQCVRAEVAPVGLINMMNAGAAVREFGLQEEQEGEESRRRVSIQLHGCGTLLLYASEAPAWASVDGERVGLQYDPDQRAARIEVPQGSSMEKRVEVQV